MSPIEKMKLARSKAEKVLIMLGMQGVELTEEETEAFLKCFGVRGKYKGYLKKQAPSATKEPLANVIYNAITPNGHKLQVYNLMMMREEHRQTYDKLSKFTYPDWLDLDKEQLKNMGVW